MNKLSIVLLLAVAASGIQARTTSCKKAGSACAVKSKKATQEITRKQQQKELTRKKSLENFEVAVASFNVEKLDEFFETTDTETVRTILNEGDTQRGPGFIEIMSVAYQMEEREEGVRLVQQAIEKGADVARTFEMPGEENEIKKETPFSVAVLFAYLTGNTEIVDLICQHGALRSMTGEQAHEVVDRWYHEMKKNFDSQFDTQYQEEVTAEGVENLNMEDVLDAADVKRSVMTQFETVRDALHTMVTTYLK